MPTQPTHNEKQLLLQIAEGNEQAFASLFHTWFPVLFEQLLQITRREDLAQEIVQEVFLKIWMARETLANISNIKGYLWVMARNRAYRELHNIARERTRQSEYVAAAADSWSNIQEAEARANNNHFMNLLDEAIDKLPPQQQQVFILSRREKLSHQEIADRMGLSVNTVKKYLQRAIEAITAFMKQHFPILAPLLPFLIM